MIDKKYYEFIFAIVQKLLFLPRGGKFYNPT